MTPHHRRLFLKRLSRSLHIYLSMLGVVTILFFAATGFMLNHDTWFGLDQVQSKQTHGSVPAGLILTLDKLALVEELRARHGVTGLLDSLEEEKESLRLVFKSPGRRTDVSIERPGGKMEITRETHGAVARIMELHKGTDAGPAWRLVIDATSILLIVSSLTGIILWLIVPKWRSLGWAALAVSTLLCVAVYLWLVPR